MYFTHMVHGSACKWRMMQRMYTMLIFNSEHGNGKIQLFLYSLRNIASHVLNMAFKCTDTVAESRLSSKTLTYHYWYIHLNKSVVFLLCKELC